VPIALHPEIDVTVTINVARSNDEAERIARGEDVISRRDEERAEQAAAVEAEAFFEKPEEAKDEAAEQPTPEQK
jgi:large subunit ribosomal protein L9